MELSKVSFPALGARSSYSGSGHFGVVGEKHLKIETTPRGKEILNVVVPKGKKWDIRLTIAITETDK